MLEIMRQWAEWAIQTGGYFGVGVMMALESMIAPVPSELVMPPLGMAIHQHPDQFRWEWAIVAASTGSLVGSIISYYLGYFGGKPVVMKVGRYLLLNEEHLDVTHRWFERWGSVTVFVSRFVPVVRHLISIPAGIARMNLLRFCLYTLAGATLWNSFLLWVGWKMEEHWEDILGYETPIKYAVAVGLVVVVGVWYGRRLRKPKRAVESKV